MPPDGVPPDRDKGDEFRHKVSTVKFKLIVGNEFTVIANEEDDDVPQLLLAVTVIFPLVAIAVVEIELVVDVPLQPDGKIQVYEVAPGTAVTEYVFDDPEQMVEVPEIVPGALGAAFTVIGNVAADELPHVLFAVTVIFPLEELAVVEIELVVEAPLQPDGKVQV